MQIDGQWVSIQPRFMFHDPFTLDFYDLPSAEQFIYHRKYTVFMIKGWRWFYIGSDMCIKDELHTTTYQLASEVHFYLTIFDVVPFDSAMIKKFMKEDRYLIRMILALMTIPDSQSST